MTEFNPEEAANAMSAPGVFSFVERLSGRGYPSSEVKIYLDEKTAFERQRLAIDIEAGVFKNVEDAAAAQEKIEQLDAQIAESGYTFVLEGFSPDRYDDIIDEAYKEFPAEYDVTVNPFSGAREKAEIHNDNRDDLLHAKLWSQSIKKIIDHKGNEDTAGLDEGTAANVRANSPIDARRKIDIRIQELRMGSAWMDSIQDEGFLATP